MDTGYNIVLLSIVCSVVPSLVIYSNVIERFYCHELRKNVMFKIAEYE